MLYIHLEFITSDNEPLILPLVVVPHICDPVSIQPIDTSKISYSHLARLELADSGDIGSNLEIGIFIGSDYYWNLVTGRVVKGDSGPTAIELGLDGYSLDHLRDFARKPL